jgi:hypothetical protein
MATLFQTMDLRYSRERRTHKNGEKDGEKRARRQEKAEVGESGERWIDMRMQEKRRK